jgi:hypothetical protein
LLFGRDADPSVGDGKAQETIVAAFYLQADAQCDLAFIRELDRITDQVDQDLAEAAGIALDYLWNFGRDFTE